MGILEKLDAEIKQAMKSHDSVRLGALRLIKTSVKNKEIELIHPLSEAEFFACLSTMV
ncbi:MAG: GatB/YqeY domain-containing protein [Deltaproteobacteria bacterium]|nr:GatB/YqeY domain-containing protein [Deltaproteobacteria bacterium]